MVDVYLWLYHTNLYEEFVYLLSPIKYNIILHLGLCENNQNTNIINLAKSEFPHLQITHHPNIGGDILPFITDFSNNTEKQNIFLKLHSKRSRLMEKIEWRVVLLHSLLGNDGKNFYSNLQQFQQNKNIGLITHQKLLFSNQEGPNTPKINELLKYYKVDNNSLTRKTFAAGTMFMGNTELYNKFLNKDSINYLRPLLMQETGYVTDTTGAKYCHSLERIFGYMCEHYQCPTEYAKYKTYRIINIKSPTKKLHLSITYSGYVFLEEDLKVHGQLLHMAGDSFTITWKHLAKQHTRQYIQISNNTYIGV